MRCALAPGVIPCFTAGIKKDLMHFTIAAVCIPCYSPISYLSACKHGFALHVSICGIVATARRTISFDEHRNFCF
jgi:hypothetical protein